MRRIYVRGLALALGLAVIRFPSEIRAETSLSDEPIGEVADFTLIERSGREVSKSDLDGKVWVACFFFTRCRTVCPQVTETMHRVQEQMRKVGYPDVVLVSIS